MSRSDTPADFILWGGTGQAKVMRPVIEHHGARLIAVFDDTPGLAQPFGDVPLYRGRAEFPALIAENRGHRIGFCVSIGNPHGRVRLELHDYLVGEGLEAVSLIHPSAVVSGNAIIGIGAQIHAGAIVNPESRLGRHCIINTKASVDHECILEDGVEIGPGATVCGSVTIEAGAWVCAGATVLPRLRIGADAIIGAGSVVRRGVPAGATYVGVPAHPIKRKERTL